MKKLACIILTVLIVSIPLMAKDQVKYSVKRLQKEYGYPIYLVPALHPSLFIRKDISFKMYKGFINRIVRHNYGNAIRVFSAGVWQTHMKKETRFPFRKVNGKFDLEQINKVWLKETLRRIEYFVERDGMVIYSLIDGCSLYDMPWHGKGWWRSHWWNGKNNINGTATYGRSIGYMFLFNDAEIEATRYYVLKFMDYIVGLLEERFKGSIVYDFNEFGAPLDWYLRVNRLVFQKHKIPRWRKMFSFLRNDENIHLLTANFVFQPHGIDSIEEYEKYELRIPEIGKVMFSADGCLPVNRKTTRELVYRILKNGDLGFENNRFWWFGITFKEQVNWNYVKGMREGFLQFYLEEKIHR